MTSGVGGAIGTGGFGDAASYAVGFDRPYAEAVGDLNGDGILDLITAGTNGGLDGYATVCLGRGDGSFVGAASYITETVQSFAAALGDLNGDGILDLVAAGANDASDGYATVRLGRGDGTFGGAASYETESGCSNAAALGDLNRDGILDLVTTGVADGNDGYATVRLGRGDGTFGGAASYETESCWSRTAALGDLNGDGILDLVTAGLTDGSDGYATVRLGRGDGTFGGAASYEMESGCSNAAALGDLNGDGILDLVTAGGTDGGDGYATVRLGRGDGTFNGAASYETESARSNAAALGDLNGDGILDLVTAGMADEGGYTTVHIGRGDGTFEDGVCDATGSRESYAVTLGDFDQDGVIDQVTGDYYGISGGNMGRANVCLAQTKEGLAPLLPFDLSTMAGARQVMPVFDQKLNQLAAQRGQIGAFQSRLTVAVAVLSAAAENTAAAAARIMDADVAAESATLTGARILQQAASAVLAQANMQPSLALKLLS